MSSGYEQHFKKMKKTSSQGTQKKKRTKTPFPAVTMISAAIILCASTWLYININDVETWLSKVEVKFLGTAIAAGEKQQKLPTPSAEAEKKSPDQMEGQSPESISTRNLTPEELALFNKLEDRRAELDKRETDLKKLEEELQHQKVMLEEKMKTLEDMRTNIAVQLDDRVKADETKVEKLVAMYSNMKPQRAARILETVNEDLAVEVLRNMKRDKAADILNMLDSAKAQKLSEKFAGYRKD